VFIQLSSEFLIGYLFAIDLLVIDAALIGLVQGAVVDNEQSIGDIDEYSYQDLQSASRGVISEIESEILANLGGLLIDNVFAGLNADSATPAIYVAACFVEALLSIQSNCGLLVSVGVDSVNIIVSGNSVLALSLAVCDVISVCIRPLSLAVRLFANTTSGILLSGLLLPSASADYVAGSVAQDICVSLGASVAFICSAVLLISVECLVGVVQVYVFTVLSQLYSTLRVWCVLHCIELYF